MEIVIITGMSGAGKTEALKCLEDFGYFSIDNLPPSLISNIIELAKMPEKKLEKIALVIDIRGGTTFEGLFKALDELKTEGVDYTIMFLDASDDVLVKRFSQTRRIHPLENEGLRVADTITEERRILDQLRESADVILDTSFTNIYDLKSKLEQLVLEPLEQKGVRLILMSFGYKFGHPLDADLVQDVRFIPNPYWVEELQELNGLDQRVIDFVFDHPESAKFVAKFSELALYLLPGYEKQRRSHLTIGLGCTGGRHRSVVFAESLAGELGARGYETIVIHRDIDK